MVDGFRYERKLADKLEQEGWHVERVSSSGSRNNSVCDLVGIKDGKAYLIEVKTRNTKVFYTKPFERNLTEIVKVSEKCKAIPLLAVLFKRRGWKFIQLNSIPKKILW